MWPQRARRGGGDVRGVVGQAERPGPRVEQLRRAGPGEHLRPQERARDVRGPVGQLGPGDRVGVHERAGGEVVARRTALDEVGGQRERRAGEPDERGAAEGVDGERDALGDGREGLRRQRTRARGAVPRRPPSARPTP